MQLTVERTGPCAARVVFRVPDEEYQERFKRRLAEAGKQVRMKGFRPGKVPPRVVQQMHGEALERDVLEGFLREAFERAVKEESLRPAAHPRVRLEDLAREPGQDLEHSFELELKPDLTLGELEGLAASFQLAEVTDEEVEATLADIRKQQARPEPAGEAGLADDGMAMTRIEIVSGDEVVASREGMRLGLENVPAGVEREAYQAAARGAVDGASVELPITLPDNFERQELRGQTALCRITFSQVFRLEQPAEEEIFKAFRASDGAELRAALRTELERSKRLQERARIEQELFQRVLDEHPMDLPPGLLENQVQSRLATARQQMAETGMGEEEIASQLESDLDAARDAAERSLKAYYLVEAISEAKGLEITREDLAAELGQIANRNRASLEEVRKYYEEHDLFRQLAIELLERKVRRYLREHSTAEEPPEPSRA